VRNYLEFPDPGSNSLTVNEAVAGAGPTALQVRDAILVPAPTPPVAMGRSRAIPAACLTWPG